MNSQATSLTNLTPYPSTIAACFVFSRKNRRESIWDFCNTICQKQTLGNDGLLRCRSRFFDQCCHLVRVRKKDCAAAWKFNDLRLGSLRHESLEVRIDHSVLFGNYCVARLLFPSCNRGTETVLQAWLGMMPAYKRLSLQESNHFCNT